MANLYGDAPQPVPVKPHHYRVTVANGDHFIFFGDWADIDLHAEKPVFIECQGGALVNLEYAMVILPVG